MTTIEQLMGLVEDAVKGYFYVQIGDHEMRYDKEDKWGIRIRNEGEYQEFTKDEAVELLNSKNLDISVLHMHLMQTVSSQAWYYRRRLKKIREALGNEGYKESIRSWDKFGENVAKVIESALRKSRVKLVKGAEQ